MVVATLGAMAKGGMRDHIGGGFHRYSVDERWRVPHFEKMLYDQAQLVLALIEASQAAADPLLAAVADDTLVYVDRDLSDAGGGFYSAEDADSIPPESAGVPGAHASEGAFYIWPQREVETLLGEADARVVALRFGLEPGGNAPFDPQQEFTGKNLLYTAATFEDIAARAGRPVDEVVDVVARARPVLLEARNRRPRPSLDDKVLTSWNGLMIAAMARAGRDPRRRRSGSRRAVDRPCRAGGALRPLGALAAGDADAAFAAGAPATPASTATARTTPASSGAASSCCRRPAIRRGWRGPARCRRRRIGCSGTTPAPAGSTPRGATRPCCSVSRRSTTAPSRRPAPSRCAT